MMAAKGEELSDRDQICRPGYARSIRPPEAVTQNMKRQLCLKQQSVEVKQCMRENEFDAIVPACLGGRHVWGNVQLQPWPIAHRFDLREAELCRLYCDGKISLDGAREAIKREKSRSN